MDNLKDKIKDLPITPGVYFFKNKAGGILYIGKAINIKNRVRSYFSSSPKDNRISTMLNLAMDVDFQKTESDIEALILESKLIKELKPKFNIMMRDDKRYFYVVFTKDIFPKILLTHQPKDYGLPEKSKNIIGPFTDGKAIKSTFNILRKIFPYCTCLRNHNRHCLNYHIGNCLGFCCLKETSGKEADKKEYGKNIKILKDILRGERATVIKNLKSDIEKLKLKEGPSKTKKIENQIKYIEKIFKNAQIIQNIKSHFDALGLLGDIFELAETPNRIEGYDISNIQGSNAVGSMIVFTNGEPDKSQYRKFKIKIKKTPDDTAMLREVIQRRQNHPEWPRPDLIFIDGGKGQINAVNKIIKNKIPIISLGKGKQEVFSTTKRQVFHMKDLPNEIKNLIYHIDAEAHRFAINYYRKLHRKSNF